MLTLLMPEVVDDSMDLTGTDISSPFSYISFSFLHISISASIIHALEYEYIDYNATTFASQASDLSDAQEVTSTP